MPGDDLVALEDVSDATMLHTLRGEYARDDIFTAIGPVLSGPPPRSCSVDAAPHALHPSQRERAIRRRLKLLHPMYSESAFSMSREPRSMHGVVPHTMTWYLPTFVRLNME